MLKNTDNYSGPKITLQYIANEIGCNKSTISREIKRGLYKDFDPNLGTPRTRYLASYGQGGADKNKKRSHYKYKLSPDSKELKEIAYYINNGADPLTALHLYKEKHGEDFPICEKSIYNYFHRKMLKIKKGKMTIRKIHVKKEKVQKMTQKGDNIDKRPIEANERLEFGHWEGDLIVGSRGGSKECLLTLIERKSRIYLSFKIKNKKSNSVIEMLNNIESIITPEKFKNIFKTITFDNGTEFRDFEKMETSINKTKRCHIFYANPYHSWERGSNENGNKMMRKYFPKGTDFSAISEKAILIATNKINFSIRKKLGNTSSATLLKKLNDDFYCTIELLGLSNPYLKLISNFS